MARNNQAVSVTVMDFPEASTMAQAYETEVGSALTEPSFFHRDIFRDEHAALLCEAEIRQWFPNMALIFDESVNYNFTNLHDCVLRCIDITRRHC